VKPVKIGVLGAGSFAGAFIPLFQAHPLVADVYVAEIMPERLSRVADRFQIATTYTNMDDLLGSDCDAIAVFSQRWLHAPQAIAALRAGKHVYSCVPAGISVEELQQLVQTVEETGLTYMMGETSYYIPATVYCRQRFRAGDMGRFVYAEAGYYHDMEHGFYPPYQGSNGPEWKRFASFPPMYYPSHSCGMILGVTEARMTSVSCLGYVDDHHDGIFDKELSNWGNDFSNETALYRTSDGGMARINEFRRVGLRSPVTGGVRCRIYGTAGCYEEQANARAWITHDGQVTDLLEHLQCGKKEPPADWKKLRKEGAQKDFFSGLAPVHDSERLPVEFVGKHNGHFGSHQFLVDDFLRACTSGELPPVNVWTAAKYCVPGVMAHESAKREGELLKIPDLGGAPA
jgi:predicted dehydrogenase